MPLLARVRPPSQANGLLNPQSRRHLDLIRFMREVGNVPYGATILDVGCGTGMLATRLTANGWTNVSGIDWLTPDQLQRGEALKEYRRVDLNEDGLRDFPDASYDCTICSDVLEHMERPALLVRELARVTRRGGAIYITLPNAFNLLQRFLLLSTGNSKRYRTEKRGEYGHISMFPSHVMQSLLNRAGLQILKEGRGFAAVGGWLIAPWANFGPWASYCRYYCLVHS